VVVLPELHGACFEILDVISHLSLDEVSRCRYAGMTVEIRNINCFWKK